MLLAMMMVFAIRCVFAEVWIRKRLLVCGCTASTCWPRWNVGLNGAICVSRCVISSRLVQIGVVGML